VLRSPTQEKLPVALAQTSGQQACAAELGAKEGDAK